jgi:hypothetical protein
MFIGYSRSITKRSRPTRGCNQLGQRSKSERWNAILEFLLKYQQQSEGGQAPEPPVVGPQ